MAKDFDWLTHEILGDIEAIAPVIRPVPDVPVLDEEPALRKRSGSSADATIADIEHAEMLSKLAPIPIDAQLDRDVARFSLALEKLVKEVWTTDSTLAEWTPVAHLMFGNLIKRARPSRRSESKVRKVSLEFNDSTKMCCPEEDDDGNYIWEGKTYRWMDVKTIQTCTHNHQGAA
jgi:hypothetical protein